MLFGQISIGPNFGRIFHNLVWSPWTYSNHFQFRVTGLVVHRVSQASPNRVPNRTNQPFFSSLDQTIFSVLFHPNFADIKLKPNKRQKNGTRQEIRPRWSKQSNHHQFVPEEDNRVKVLQKAWKRIIITWAISYLMTDGRPTLHKKPWVSPRSDQLAPVNKVVYEKEWVEKGQEEEKNIVI
jgi:hypothetical protein